MNISGLVALSSIALTGLIRVSRVALILLAFSISGFGFKLFGVPAWIVVILAFALYKILTKKKGKKAKITNLLNASRTHLVKCGTQ